jgi:hypothetical protein
MAQQYFFPKSIPAQREWLVIYAQQLPTVGPSMGMTAVEISDNVDAANAVIASIDAASLAENVYKQSVEAKDNAVRNNVSGVILPAVKRFKTASSYTTDMGRLLGVEGTDLDFDPDTYQAQGSAKVLGNDVKISFTKAGADGVAIYSRVTAAAAGVPAGNTSPPPTVPPTPAEMLLFSKLAIDHHSPYVDNRPLARPGIPELREYYLRGMVDDAEIGLPSLVIRVVVGAVS